MAQYCSLEHVILLWQRCNWFHLVMLKIKQPRLRAGIIVSVMGSVKLAHLLFIQHQSSQILLWSFILCHGDWFHIRQNYFKL